MLPPGPLHNSGTVSPAQARVRALMAAKKGDYLAVFKVCEYFPAADLSPFNTSLPLFRRP